VFIDFKRTSLEESALTFLLIAEKFSLKLKQRQVFLDVSIDLYIKKENISCI